MMPASRTAGAETSDLATRIEDVATRLFIQHGYNGVSYLDIARELGTTHSNVHYYFRTKAKLAEVVLRSVSETTNKVTTEIWTDEQTDLLAKFIKMRDWIHSLYLMFNPAGRGSHPWGLLSRFSMEADALTSDMRATIRATLAQFEASIATGVRIAVEHGELRPDAPQAGITLQIISVMSLTGLITRHASGLDRLDELMRWTYLGIVRAYGASPTEKTWTSLPASKARGADAETQGRKAP
jgi:AcrR family transcriptional regulator